jgi:hypothetical protein
MAPRCRDISTTSEAVNRGSRKARSRRVRESPPARVTPTGLFFFVALSRCDDHAVAQVFGPHGHFWAVVEAVHHLKRDAGPATSVLVQGFPMLTPAFSISEGKAVNLSRFSREWESPASWSLVR